jgi:RND superfamily putative drug exporter
VSSCCLTLGLPLPRGPVRLPDAGNNREETGSRQAYDMLAEGFGAGMNGPLLLVAEVPQGSLRGALDQIGAAVAETPGVAAVAPATLNPDGDTAVVTVLPTTGPQDSETVDLVNTLRDRVLPGASEGTGVTVHVGGVTATSIDSSDNIAKRLPLLIGGVVLLSMLLLVASFRSIAVAVKAAVMNLLSVAAAYGVVALVLQGGWVGQLIGIDTPTPLPAFVPGADVRGAVRPVDGLRGVPGQPHAGGLAAHPRQRAGILGGSPAPAG